jgi:hypothetical protein
VGRGFSHELLWHFPRPSLEFSPEAFFPADPAQTTETAVWYSSLAFGGAGSFTGDFVVRHNKTHALFLFTQPKLHHQLLRMQRPPRHPLYNGLRLRRAIHCYV